MEWRRRTECILVKRQGIKWLRKYKRQRGIKLTKREAEQYEKEVLEKLIKELKNKYPEASRFFDAIPSLFIESENIIYSKAQKCFNATSFDYGATGITYAYIEQYMISCDKESKMEKDKLLDIIAAILLHEMAHHMFRIKVGFRPMKRSRSQLMHYVNELYADNAAFSMLRFTSEEAVENLKERFVLEGKKDALYHSSMTHPSNYERIMSLKEEWGLNELVEKASEIINMTKQRTYVKQSDVEFVKAMITDFKAIHPEIDVPS